MVQQQFCGGLGYRIHEVLALTFCPPNPITASRGNCGRMKVSYHQQEQPTGPGFINEDVDEQYEHPMGVFSLPKEVQNRARAGAAHTEGERVQGSRKGSTVSP